MYSWTCSSGRPPWASWRCRSNWGADTNMTLHCKQIMSPRTYQGRWLNRAWSTIFERFLPWRLNLQLGYGHLAKSTVPSAFWWRTPEDVPCGCTYPASSLRGATSGTSSRDPDAGCWGSPWSSGSPDWSLDSTEGPGNRFFSVGTITECGDFSPRKLSREGWPSCSAPAEEEMDSAPLQWACPPLTLANPPPVAKETMADQHKPQEEDPLTHHPLPWPPPPQDFASGPSLSPPWE